MRDTNFINLCAFALVLVDPLLAITRAAFPVRSANCDRNRPIVIEGDTVLPASERRIPN
jgi:hypothetical protein